MLERVFERARVEPVVALRGQQHTWVDRSGAGSHHETLERGHAHRCADRAPVPHRADGAARAEMGNDDAEVASP